MKALVRVLTLFPAFAVAAACGGGGGGGATPGGGGGGAPAPLAGANLADAAMYAATPADDALIGNANARASRYVIATGVPPMRTQLLNDCVGWSVGYWLKTQMEHTEEGWDVSQEANQFSPAFIYNQRPNRNLQGGCRDVDPQTGQDQAQGCMNPEDALRTLVNAGCCRWPNMSGLTGNGLTQPSQTAFTEALRYKALSYVRFGAIRSLTDPAIADMKAWLRNNRTAITFGVYISQPGGGGWYDYRGANNGVCLDAVGSGLSQGGHMMTILGYDDHLPYRNTGSFLVVNQYGTQWGANGFMWLPYSELKKVWMMGFGVRDATNGSGQAAPTPTGNDSLANADPLVLGSSSQGSIDPNDPADWWKFTVGANARVTIRLTGMTGDLDMKLADANDVRLGNSNESSNNDEEIIYSFAQAGTYYVKVYPYNTASSSYVLTATTAAAESNDSATGATVLTPGQAVQGSVGGADPVDWFSFSVPNGTVATLALGGLSQDIDLYLYDATANGGSTPVARSEFSGTSSESISHNCVPGRTYHVLVHPYTNNAGNYTLLLSTGNQPDLQTITWSATANDFSDRVELTVTNLVVRNVGTAPAQPFSVAAGAADGTTPGSNIWLGTSAWVYTQPLPAGQEGVWTNGVGTISKAALPNGQFWLFFVADSQGQIAEPNELNNFALTPNPVLTK